MRIMICNLLIICLLLLYHNVIELNEHVKILLKDELMKFLNGNFNFKIWFFHQKPDVTRNYKFSMGVP